MWYVLLGVDEEPIHQIDDSEVQQHQQRQQEEEEEEEEGHQKEIRDMADSSTGRLTLGLLCITTCRASDYG